MNIDEAMEKAGADLDAAPPPETEPAPAIEAPPVEAAPVEDPPKADGRERNADGTFKTKAPEKPGKPGGAARKPEGTPAAQGEKGPAVGQPPATAATPPVAEKPLEPKHKPPQSWKPAVREKWAALPPEVQEEVARREVETARVLNETAQVRQFAQGVQQSLSVYAPIAQANGKDVMTWAGEGLQSYAALMQGAPEAAVNAAAQAVRVLTQRFGPQAVDMLVAAVEGKGGAPMPGQPQPVNPEVQRAQMREEARRVLEEEQRRALSIDWVTKHREDPDFEAYFPRLVERIADSGGKMTPDQAYDAVRWEDPEYRQRQAAQAVEERLKQQTAQAQQARAAAGQSIRSSSAPPSTRPAKMTEQAALELAAQKHGF